MFILELTNGSPLLNSIGIGIFEYDQAKALQSLGNKVVFVSLDMRSIRRRRKLGFQKLTQDNIETYNYSFPLGRVWAPIINAIAFRCFKKLYKKILNEHGKPDIIHAHFGRFAGEIAKRIKQKFGIDYIVTEHDSSVSNCKISECEKNKLIEVYKNSSAVIAVSQPFANILKDKYFVDNVKVINNIVDKNSFSLSLIAEKPNFISIGALKKGKGMDITIDAFKIVCDNGYDSELYIIGEGAERVALEQQIAELNLDARVHLIGHIPRQGISHYFDKSFCFVLASRGETFGVVYIEAMCAGLPVIGTKCGGPESFITDNTGIIVEENTPDNIASAMIDSIKNRNRYNASTIRDYALSKFAPEVIAQEIIDVLEDIK